jgi:hypothetical protein
LKDDSGDPGEPVDPPVDPGDDLTAPVRTDLQPSSGIVTGTSTTLSLTTNVAANCKYTKSGVGVDYNDMKLEFDNTGGTDHSEPISGLVASEAYDYYIRCKNLATGAVNTTDAVISFTVSGGTVMKINKAMQMVGDLLVAPAFAQDSTTTIPTTGTTPDTGTDTDPDPSTPTNIFDPNKKDFIDEGILKMGAGNGSFTARMEKLQPGTFFYARAYAVADGQIYYGNQVGFRTGDSCFIATAAFGSIFHPCVQILRDFRDSYMLDNHLGRSLVTSYYRYSPYVADVIAVDSTLRLITRILLLPLVGAAWLALQLGMKGLLLLPVTAALYWYMMMRPGVIYRRA